MPGTTCQKAIQLWSEKNDGAAPEEATVVKLLCLSPPIEKMDPALNLLVNVRHLSLSTNCIDKMISLPALKNLEILSLGRNVIKKIAGLEEVGATLRELWISYNSISTLDGLNPCLKLQTLFISNNKIKDWNELVKLQQLPELSNILLVGNPIYEGLTKRQARPRVVEQLPDIKSVDGEMITGTEAPEDEEPPAEG
uniref:Dynein axonemal light chain 1 n=1 Tax=Noctiluca scintillans TaxID=2966 RepID=A0A7S1AAG3_NOCSC